MSILKISDPQSGVEVKVTHDYGLKYNTSNKMRKIGMSLLRSKLWAIQNNYNYDENHIVASIELEDGNEYPHELEQYRRPIGPIENEQCTENATHNLQQK